MRKSRNKYDIIKLHMVILHLCSGDEWMPQCFGWSAPLLRVQIQTAVQKIYEQIELLDFHVVHASGVRQESRSEIPCWFCDIQYSDNILYSVLASINETIDKTDSVSYLSC